MVSGHVVSRSVSSECESLDEDAVVDEVMDPAEERLALFVDETATAWISGIPVDIGP
jgi:hypothetical protein